MVMCWMDLMNVGGWYWIYDGGDVFIGSDAGGHVFGHFFFDRKIVLV